MQAFFLLFMAILYCLKDLSAGEVELAFDLGVLITVASVNGILTNGGSV